MPTTKSASRTSAGFRACLETAGVWISATRPRTLGASVVPVLVGTAAAARTTAIDPPVFAVTLATAVMLQVAANLANDYFDFQKGVDTDRRLGPRRVTQSGLLAPQAVGRALVLVLAASAAAGVFLSIKGGWPILLIGVAALAGAVAYSAGPRPLSWHGLGDPLAFVFFGLVAVYGTIHLLGGSFDTVSLVSALPVGCLVTTIIIVNNLRDIPTDRDCGKRTLAVRIGPRATRWEYSTLVVCAYLFLAVLALAASPALLLPLLSVPIAIDQIARIWRADGAALNANLLGTVRLHLVFGLLLALGLSS